MKDAKAGYFTKYDSPAGTIMVAMINGAVTDLSVGSMSGPFVDGVECEHQVPFKEWSGAFAMLLRKFDQYFCGAPTVFDIPVNPSGTAFELSVWWALAKIPWGEVRSYAEVAALVGNTDACRAVGSACSRNPVPIIIPCHRVVRSDGGIGGFSAGEGTKLKRLLLGIEGVLV